MSVEKFKVIKGFSDYFVSNQENVFSLKRLRFLKPYQHCEGYLTVKLFNKKRSLSFQVHRLVSSAFLTNPDKKPFVDHINNCKSDKRLINLRYATRSENGMNMSQRSDNKC